MRSINLFVGLFFLNGILLSCIDKKNDALQTKTLSHFKNEISDKKDEKKGFVHFSSNKPSESIYKEFLAILQSNPGVQIIGSLDHQANATNAGLEMPFSKVIYLYNKHIASQLIAENPLAGLDVPTRILFYDIKNSSHIQLFHESYYISKFNLNSSIPNAESASRVFSKVLETIINEGTSSPIQLKQNEGITEKKANSDFETVAKKIVTSIANHPKVDLFFVIDHQNIAKEHGIELPPSLLLFFGNASTGTQLMLETPSLAFDLPLKILVFQDTDGTTKIAYNNMKSIFERHQFSSFDASSELTKLLDTLTSLD